MEHVEHLNDYTGRRIAGVAGPSHFGAGWASVVILESDDPTMPTSSIAEVPRDRLAPWKQDRRLTLDGSAPAREIAPEPVHEVQRLFAPAPAVMPGQTGMRLDA